MNYPETKTVDVVDDYFGNQVTDAYRWLEDTESKETADWIATQNELTQSYLESLPQRADMRERLEKLWNYERFGLPRKRGETYFYTHNDGLQDQSVLYKAGSLEADREVLIDPNTLSEDGTVALSGTVTTEDGKLMAYALADGGSDWRTWKVRDVASGKDLDDVVQWVKFSSIAWKPDGSGFFYSRYKEPVEGEELLATNENQKMYFHTIGTDQSGDPLILEKPDHPK
ncbi:MAG: S9 family peptidase, partial [Pirellulaceae bacterium]